MRISLVLILIFSCFQSSGQTYIDGGKTRHRFAQLNAGFEFRNFPAGNSQSSLLNNSGVLETYQLKNRSQGRLIIGGIHFWGHADFFISLPIVPIGKSEFNAGVETGARYFPWRIEHNKVRPYMGVSLLRTEFKQGDGVKLIRFRYPALAGLVFNFRNNLLEAGGGYIFKNSFTYFNTTSSTVHVKVPDFWISIGFKLMIETTLSAENDWKSGRTKQLTDTLASKGKLNGLTFAIGPSSAFYIRPGSHNKDAHPYIDEHRSSVFPEYGIGYYFYKPDLQFNLSYRSNKSEIHAFGFSQEAKRRALTFEAFKFIFDYHGFAFFTGACASFENLYVIEKDDKNYSETLSYSGIKPAIVFGWDIRPNCLQTFYLRTNLRYFPNLNVKMSDSKNVSFDQLEFNFIQLVIFPGRLF